MTSFSVRVLSSILIVFALLATAIFAVVATDPDFADDRWAGLAGAVFCAFMVGVGIRRLVKG